MKHGLKDKLIFFAILSLLILSIVLFSIPKIKEITQKSFLTNHIAEYINTETVQTYESIPPKNINEKSTTDRTLFSFAVSGDNRPEDDNSPQPEVFINILDNIKEFNPSFYINTGDIIKGGSEEETIIKRQFSDYLEAVSILNCPIYVAAGNHEVKKDAGRKYFNELFNSDGKTYYYFEYKNTFFIILDAYYEGTWGAIKGDQLSWLKNLLPSLKTEKVFVFVHPPIYSVMNPDCINNESMHVAFSDKQNQDDLRKLFKDSNVDGVFSGHEHLFNLHIEESTEYIITGCSGANPYVDKEEGGFYHFLIIDVKEDSWILKVFDENGNLKAHNEFNFN